MLVLTIQYLVEALSSRPDERHAFTAHYPPLATTLNGMLRNSPSDLNLIRYHGRTLARTSFLGSLGT